MVYAQLSHDQLPLNDLLLFFYLIKNIDLCHVRKCQIPKIPENYIIYYHHKNILMIDKILQLSHGL